MEKFFSDYSNCIPATNEAIYNVRVADFQTLSKLNKTTLIRDPRCSRIIHRGQWETKGQAIIDRPVTPTAEEEVKSLILSLSN